MPEDTTPAGDPQAGDPVVAPLPQAGNTTTPEPPAGDGQSDTFSLEEAKKLRSEAANLRKRLKSYEDAEKKAQEAQLSEVERIKKQHADLQSQHDALLHETQELKVQSAIERVASKLSFLHPEIAVRLVDRAAIEYEDDGTPKNIEKLLEKLLKHMPELAQTAQAAPAPNGTTAPTAGTPAQPAPPAIPAMNPGRTAIAAPNTLPPGQVPSWSDIFKRP